MIGESSRKTRPAPPALPDFARVQWASSAARSIWEPRITEISRNFAAAELATVENGARVAALQSVTPEGLIELAGKAAAAGLVATPLRITGRASSYAASSSTPDPGGPFDFRVAVTRPGDAEMFSTLYAGGSDSELGILLGYPQCCREFFLATWGEGSVDPTWAMSDHGDGPPEANILLRWLGVRWVPHMPCGFRCEATISRAQYFRAAMPARESLWLDELLDSPMEWSALNGIGEVKTPIVSLNFRSDAAPELRTIRRVGTRYPLEGAHGLRFPYRPPPARRVDPRTWTDNGFTSSAAMDNAHGVLLEAAGPPPPEGRAVLDLGCGNGRLARRLAGAAGIAVGVELDSGRAARAVEHLDELRGCDLAELELEELGELVDAAELVVIMPGRLQSLPADRVSGFVDVLSRARAVLAYAYGDWLEDATPGALASLCRASGMPGKLTRLEAAVGAVAALWSSEGRQ